MKAKMLKIKDFIVSQSKILFPVVVIAIVAVTVVVALSIKNSKEVEPDMVQATPAGVSDSNVTLEEEPVVLEVPLELNANESVNSLIYTYYDALGNGDDSRIAEIQNVPMDDMQKIKIQELGKYIDYYTEVKIYTKPGPEAGSYIIYACTKVKFVGFEEEAAGYESFYVCTKEDGSIYLNKGVVSEEVLNYINEVNFQDDVVELQNKVTVEYNETMVANPDLFEYVATMESDIRTATGLMIAAQEAGSEQADTTAPEEGDGTQPEEVTQETGSTTETTSPIFATANATVNVRSSDSETADKLGKVSSGSKIEMLEQKVNGWSKVKFESKEGYIKSEYLQVAQNASGVETVGSVTATTNINIRSTPSETGDKLGVLAGGESLSLVSTENGWCKVVYNNQVAYVKSDYVQ